MGYIYGNMVYGIRMLCNLTFLYYVLMDKSKGSSYMKYVHRVYRVNKAYFRISIGRTQFLNMGTF